ncbi:shikimate dehydrogenase [Notoacmeibacter sp. MSK16QG-6]|uniref:shikimate dehydrogenase n=1 Tax=Notoacmeibacter sp. MSK16QG-6 TaxID=2957982 RepID=UPI00209FB935|nr:shikimate dehydrogenase [Notoacmeibacter sp. MSK16QG-6]MCP1199104.1 shikimate dehydrogenase [Notoacmeibacter sp. MSK16QG-6]
MAKESVRAGVIGHPIGHSRSPMIHNNWLGEYGIAGSYDAYDISPADLSDFFSAMRKGRMAGCNVTIPHKEAVLEHLDCLTGTAEVIGAVNTVWREGDRLIGDNTDAYGFCANLNAEAPNWDRNGGRALVLGAGGAALAIVHALIERGFGQIDIANRTAERANRLAQHFGERCRAVAFTDEPSLYDGADFVANTTTLTMGEGADGRRWPGLDRLTEGATVTDIVYTPLQTSLLAAAKRHGYRTVDGLGMLLYQAVPGFERWFGVRPEVTGSLRAKLIADLEAHA